MIHSACVSEGTSVDNPLIELEGATTEEIEANSFVVLSSSSQSRYGNHYLTLRPDQQDYEGYRFYVQIDPKGRTIHRPRLVIPQNFQFQGNDKNFESLVGNCPNIISHPCTIELLYVPRNNFQFVSEILFHYTYDGKGYRSRLPLEVKASNPVDSLVSGGAISDGMGQNSCAIGKGGEIKCWGNLEAGNLGIANRDAIFGDTVDELNNRLDKVSFEDEILDLKISFNHACVLLKDNKLKCWGHNNDGEVGTDNSRFVSLDDIIHLPPLKFKKDHKVVQFSLGDGFTCALLEKPDLSRDVQCWGRNDYGQAGTGDVFPLGYGFSNSKFDLDAVKVNFNHPSRIEKLVSSRSSSCVLFADGKVSCWGSNEYGELGKGNTNALGDQPGETLNNFVDLGTGKIAVDIYSGYGVHFCAKLSATEAKCWGNNQFGQLGIGTSNNMGDESSEMGDDLPVIDLDPDYEIISIHPSLSNTCMTLKDTTLDEGVDRIGICFGLGTRNGQGSPLTKGDDAGEVLALPPIDFGSDFQFSHFLASYQSTCAISTQGKIKCFGANINGTLGQGHSDTIGDSPFEMGDSLIETKFPSHTVFNDLIMGPHNTCAITDKKYLSCYGSNARALIYGSIGADIGVIPGNSGASLNTVKIDSIEKATQVTVGEEHACALFENEKVKCWGKNDYGQLAQGNSIDIIDLENRFNEVPYIDFGNNVKVKSVHAGAYHTCAKIFSDVDGVTRVKCWGKNDKGQIGVGSTANIGDQLSELGENLPYLDFGTDENGSEWNVLQVAAGNEHNCALLTGARTPFGAGQSITTVKIIKCWGGNSYGQLGQENSLDSGNSPGEMGNNLKEVVIGDFESYTDENGVLQSGIDQINTWIDIKLGANHSCARASANGSGEIYCWGRNHVGQLGVGHTINIGDNGNEMKNFIQPVQFISVFVSTASVGSVGGHYQWSVGGNHGCVIHSTNKRVACWGNGAQIPSQRNENVGDGNLPITIQLLPFISGKSVFTIHARRNSTCLVYFNGEAMCWGKGRNLGNGRFHNFSTYYPEVNAFPYPFLWF